MLYAPRIQDGSEATEFVPNSLTNQSNEQLEQRVEQLNSAIADVRKQLEELGS